MTKEYSKGYKIICRFFKEIKLYKEFTTYQRNGEKYVRFKCTKIPFDTNDCFGSFGKTCITAWMEDVKNVTFEVSLLEMFRIWVKYNYPHIYPDFFNFSEMQLNENGKKIFNKKTKRFEKLPVRNR